MFQDKTFLITGASGMIGSAFSETLVNHFGVPASQIIMPSHWDLDVTERDQVLRVSKNKIDVILHCAAYTNVDRCESESSETRKINLDGTLNMAELAKETGAALFFPQTFLIFDGVEDSYHEGSRPNPLSTYAKIKWESEIFLRESLPRSLIVRMGGFIGGDAADKNFAGKFIQHVFRLLQTRTPRYEVGPRIWQPTYVIDLAKNILHLLSHEKTGTYHMASDGEASFYSLAREIVQRLGFSKHLEILPADGTSHKEAAKRPDRVVLENRRLRLEGLDQQRTWQSGVADYINRPYIQNQLGLLKSYD